MSSPPRSSPPADNDEIFGSSPPVFVGRHPELEMEDDGLASSPVIVSSPPGPEDPYTPMAPDSDNPGSSPMVEMPGSSPMPQYSEGSSAVNDLSSALRSEFGTPSRRVGRRADIQLDSRRVMDLDSSGPMSVSSSHAGSDVNGGPSRIIWGTTVSLQETGERFRQFLQDFTQADRIRYDGRAVLPGDADATIYMDIIKDMRTLETSVLNLDARNLLAFAPTQTLYYQLIDFPAEVIAIMDDTLKLVLSQIIENDPNAGPEEHINLQMRPIRVRPYGLETMKGLRELNPTDIDKLVSIKGLVLRANDVIPDMQEAFFRCAVCNHSVVHRIDRGLIVEPTVCPRKVCAQKQSMQLVHNRSTFNDKQIVRLQETPDAIPDGQTPHSVSILVYDELVDYAKAGTRAEITGIFKSVPVRANPGQRTLKSLYKTYVDVLHIQKVDNKRLGFDPTTALDSQVQDDQINRQSDMDEQRQLSEADLEKILEISQRPDVYELLARSVAPSIFEQEDVKKGILLQLFGGSSKTFEKSGSPRYRGDINILLCGDPSTSKSQILQYVHKIAPRGMYTSGKGSSAVGLTAYVTRDTESRQLVLESGALVLSDGGVCCIDEFDKMSDSTRSVLHEVMEQQTVSIAKAGIITTLNARTSILASANPINSQYNPRLSVPQNIDLPPTLLSRFDLVYLMIDKIDFQADRLLADHLTSMYLEDRPENATSNEILPVEFLTMYISYAKQNFQPVITPEAKERIVNEYVQMRKLGEDVRASERRVTATTRQLESIIRLSEARAKLRLSEEVVEADVIEAVRLIRGAIKDYATDPITGLIDMDLVQTGMSSAQRRQQEVFTEELVVILEQAPGGIPERELYRRFMDISRDALVERADFQAALNLLVEENRAEVVGPSGQRTVRLLF